jgi:hypothetical protein
MASYDFRKGMLSNMNEKTDNKLSDFEEGKYVFFNKNNLFTLGNGDGQADFDKESIKNNLHLGQLKLLLSEMQTIIYYTDTTVVKNMVYVGAAHGYHIYVLAKLFPQLTYHLYDISSGWDKRLYDLKNVIINNHYFEEKDVKEWQKRGEEIIFVSDIRNLEVGREEDTKADVDKFEQLVGSDMLLQQTWVEQLKPALALLKFRLPYPDIVKKETQYYLDGTVFRQIFARPSSAETRLLVTGLAYRDWNLINYDRMNAYFNRYIRPKGLYFNPIDGSKKPIYKRKGLYNDFESTATTIIVMDYLKKINSVINETNILKILDFILDNCYGSRKLNLNTERKKI